MEKGFKPLPVLLKIVFILLSIGIFMSLFSIFGVYRGGFTLLGNDFFGLWAVNIVFVLNLVAPVILVIGMMMRTKWVWPYSIFLFAFFIINGIMEFNGLEERVYRLLEESELSLPYENPETMMYYIIVAVLINGILYDLFLLISFLVNRKYFNTNDFSSTDKESDLLS